MNQFYAPAASGTKTVKNFFEKRNKTFHKVLTFFLGHLQFSRLERTKMKQNLNQVQMYTGDANMETLRHYKYKILSFFE